jgi:hypothetical protein
MGSLLDRWRVALKNRVTQNVSVMGTQSFGALFRRSWQHTYKNNPAITMFTTEKSFGALVPVDKDHNQLLVWGTDMPVSLPDLQDIQSVYNNGSSLAFIYKNHPERIRLVRWDPLQKVE